MKTIKLTVAVLLGLISTFTAKAQNKDFYAGKWEVLVYGTPYGNVKRFFIMERKDGKLVGTVQDSTGKEKIDITSIEEKNKKAAINYTTQGYDVTLAVEPVDNDHIKGSLAGFNATGIRRKEKK